MATSSFPDPPGGPLQLVDVRDLAAWIVVAAEQRLAGAFNATGPTTMGAVVDAARRVTGASARAVEVDDAFLGEHEVGEWMELPLWVDTRQEDWRHFLEVDVSKAVAAGLDVPAARRDGRRDARRRGDGRGRRA